MSESKDQATVNITGFQFSKGGIALNFVADTNNDVVILKGKAADLPLSIAECGQLIQVLRDVLNVVISHAEHKENENRREINFNDLPKI
jgi:hypothetical protein